MNRQNFKVDEVGKGCRLKLYSRRVYMQKVRPRSTALPQYGTAQAHATSAGYAFTVERSVKDKRNKGRIVKTETMPLILAYL